ncbi:srg family chemoreceptor domain-containing protein [Ditylenchus destructor]|uniref:Serpentine receptor class gamma n=1 Tax=Ditylenchus destructor TaxID=166010 RepID=A0AAD4QXR4_9BILA|nr:srg family chemoreceptor domain-containing protein [Ditylenchus destructor]
MPQSSRIVNRRRAFIFPFVAHDADLVKSTVCVAFSHEIAWWWTNMWKYRAAIAPIFFPFFVNLPSESWSITLLFFLNYTLPITSRTLDFLLTLNRFTVMHLSGHVYEKIWRYLIPISVILICVVASGMNMSILLNGCYMSWPSEAQYLFHFDPYDRRVEYRESLYNIVVIAAFAPATLVFNLSIAYSLWRRQRINKKNGQKSGNGSRDAEGKLCVLTFMMMVTNLICLVCQTCFFAAGGGQNMDPGFSQTLSTVQGFAEDLHTLSQPWMLVYMSKGVRRSLIKLMSFGHWRSDPVSMFTNTHSKAVVHIKRNPVKPLSNSMY